MRAAREAPRVAIAKALAVACLLAVGLAIGVVIAGDNGDETRATQVRLDSAERQVHERAAELQRSRTEVRGAVAARARAQRALARLRRENRGLRRDLLVTRYVLRRERSKR